MPGVPAKIAVVEMDGSNPRVLLSVGIRSPSYMTLDAVTQTLYFTDTFHRKVRSRAGVNEVKGNLDT